MISESLLATRQGDFSDKKYQLATRLILSVSITCFRMFLLLKRITSFHYHHCAFSKPPSVFAILNKFEAFDHEIIELILNRL